MPEKDSKTKPEINNKQRQGNQITDYPHETKLRKKKKLNSNNILSGINGSGKRSMHVTWYAKPLRLERQGDAGNKVQERVFTPCYVRELPFPFPCRYGVAGTRSDIFWYSFSPTLSLGVGL